MRSAASLFVLLCFARPGASIRLMAKESDFEKASPTSEEEDRTTLEAIDDGLGDAKAGRTVRVEQVRKLLTKWISESSLRKER